MRGLLLGLAGIAACYSPAATTACSLSCALDTECPDGLQCSGHACAPQGTICTDAGPVVTDDAFVENCAGLANGLRPNTCFESHPTDLKLQNETIDTDSSPRCDPTKSDACYVVGNSIDIVGPVRGSGSRPLVLWSASTIVVSSTALLDVASHRGGNRGPASDGGNCLLQPSNTDSTGMPTVGSGGRGGSHASQGGGAGSGRAPSGQAVQLAGLGQNPLELGLYGGCSGSAGGASPNTGGAGGGAVYLMASKSITVAGTINASGQGGEGGFSANTAGGGGGGGAGGLIAFDTPMLDIGSATLVALGGGGGAGTSSGLTADAGDDPSATGTMVAAGGQQNINSNAGGDGSSLAGGSAQPGGAVAAGVAGGGGGGGGAGFIVAFGFHTGAATSAPPLQNVP